MKYSEKLKDPRWQKKRLMILKRDGFKCMNCLSGIKMLSIHHKYYRTDFQPWDYPNKSLITLCQDCHSIAESIDFANLWKRRLKLRLEKIFRKNIFFDILLVILFKIFNLKHV